MARSVESETLSAVQTLLAPIARLMLAHGLKLAQAQELLKAAFVTAAVQARGAGSTDRMASVISVATGLHRKEVQRLLASPPATEARGRSYAAEVFARWATGKRYRGPDGKPKPLPRTSSGDGGPTFEELTRAVSTDVHPRSILEELKRLNLAVEDGGMVRLIAQEYFAGTDKRQALSFLAANVGDHLTAAVANVTATDTPPFLEQALFADELSAESARAASALATQAWRSAFASILPQLQAMADRDAKGAEKDWRVRIGVFALTDNGKAAPPPAGAVRGKRAGARVAAPTAPSSAATKARAVKRARTRSPS